MVSNKGHVSMIGRGGGTRSLHRVVAGVTAAVTLLAGGISILLAGGNTVLAYAADPNCTAGNFDALRACVNAAPQNGSEFIVMVTNSFLTNGSGSSIAITPGKNITLTAVPSDPQLKITNNVYNAKPLFYVSGATLTVRGITLQGGSSTSSAGWSAWSSPAMIYLSGRTDSLSFLRSTLNIDKGAILQVNADRAILAENSTALVNIRGGLIQYNGQLPFAGDFNQTTFYNDARDTMGGGILLSNGASLTMTDGEISRNDAYNGAGIACAGGGSVNISGGLVSNNMITGTAYAPPGSSVGAGGGYYDGGGCALSVSGTADIETNMATGGLGPVGGNGGGINIGSVEGAAPSSLSITGGTIANNIAANVGGGIYIGSNTNVVSVISNVKISNNIAPDAGGGVYYAPRTSASPGTLTIANSTISNNSSGRGDNSYAGGIFMGYNSNLILNHTTVSNNKVNSGTYNVYGPGGGGGIYMQGNQGSSVPVSLTVNDSQISGNTSANSGGGIRASNTRVYVTNSAITSNSSGYDGGGIYADCTTGICADSTAVNISGASKISGNSAGANLGTAPLGRGGNGGGIFVSYPNLSLVTVGPDVVFSGNLALLFTIQRAPIDDATYQANIAGTSWTNPNLFKQGYNNDDISYLAPQVSLNLSGQPTDPDRQSVGDSITWVYTVTNPTWAYYTLTGLSFTDQNEATSQLQDPTPIVCGPDKLSPNDTILAPKQSIDCTNTSKIRQVDIDNGGQVLNNASVAGSITEGTTLTKPYVPYSYSPGPAVAEAVGLVKLSIPVNPAVSSLTIAKTGSLTMLNGTDARPGDPITWLFTVTNTGETDLTNIVITDPMLGETPAITCQTTDLQPAPFNPASGTLPAGATITCQATTLITQTDIDNGSVTNTASVTATNPDSEDDSVEAETPDPAVVDITQTHTVDVVKTADDVTADTVLKPGDTVSFTIKVTNTGNTVTTGITVTDETMPGLTITCDSDQPNGAISLEPGGQVTCHTSSYTVTVGDATNGQIDNQVTVTNGDDGTTGGDDVIIPVNPLTSSLKIVKTGSLTMLNNTDARPGDPILWTFTVTNTGETDLSDIVIDDPQLGGAVITCQIGTENIPFNLAAEVLPAGEQIICQATTTISQTDIDTGLVENSASVTAANLADPEGEMIGADTGGPTVVVIPQTHTVDVVKTADNVTSDTVLKPGDTVSFTIKVTNTGNTTTNNILVTDVTMPGLTITCDGDQPNGAISLGVGEQVTCHTSPYTVTSGDATNGQIDNQVTVTNGDDGTTGGDDVIIPVNPAVSSITISKTGSLTMLNGVDPRPGDPITWLFTVTNTGETGLTNIVITDPQLDGATITCVTTDLQPVPFNPDSEILPAGDTITCQATTLITQTDIDNGSVENSASVSATNPDNQVIARTPDPVDPVDETIGADTGGPTVVVIPQTHTVDVVKTADNVTSDTVLKPGDTVSFTIVVTNTGNTTTTGITVTDETMPDLEITCDSDQPNGAISLEPGGQITCHTSSYTVTAGDATAGQIDNQVTVSNGDDDTTGGDDVIIPVNPAVSSLTIVKTGSLTMLNGVDPRPGDPITWLFTVTNTGETSLSNIAIDDPQLDGAAITCVTGTEETPFNPASEVLPAGEQIICQATTLITQTDIDNGSVENSASVSATNPDNQVIARTPDPVDETIGADTGGPTVVVIPQTHTVDVVKTADNVTSDTVLKPGDTVAFTIVVTNTGNTTTTGITVTDVTMPGLTITCDDQENGSISLAPGASIVCRTSSYTVTPADATVGQIDNQVTVTNGDDDTTGGDDVVIPVEPLVSSITISKTGSLTMLNGIDPRPGDPITWLFTVTNTGETGLTNIVITDPQLDGATITCVTGTEETPFNPDSETLSAGDTITCTATTLITQTDIDEGSVTNTASVTATNPDSEDDPVEAETPDPAVVDITQTHTVDVLKTADNVTADTVLKPGDQVSFTIKVTNTGNTVTTGITVTDETMPGLTVTCDGDQPNGAISLNVGEQVTCHTSPYTVTTADATVGQIDNQVTVTNGDDGTTGGDDVIIPVNPLTSSLKIVKTGSLTMLNGIDPRPGDPITWLFTIENTGETDLTNIVIDDPMLEEAGAAITCVTGTEETPFNPDSETLSAGATITCTATTLITQTDIDEGSVTNTASVTATNPDDPDSDQVTAETPDPAQVDITQTHTVDVVKTADNVTSDTVLKPGDTVAFTIKVTNTGNTTTNNILVTDETMPGLTITCDDQENGSISLAPGASITCHTSPYTVTTADAAVGQISNRVSVSNGDDDTTGGDDVIIPVNPAVSSMTISKTGSLTMLNGIDPRPGDPITWLFTVTNTGETDLSDIVITDPQLDGATITCVTGTEETPFNPDSETLPAGATITCTATTQITQTDIDTGSVTNSASVTATNPDSEDDPVEAETPDPAVVDITQTHTVDVVKTADNVTSDTVLKPGDTVAFTIEVTNTGNTATNNILVTDETMPGLTITCDTDQPNGAISLEPGGQVTCHTSLYTVTAGDATAGQIDNRVTVSNGDDDTTGSDDVVIPVEPLVSSITISKTGSLTMLNGVDPRPGDPVTWLFTVTNTGETGLTNIVITDPMLTSAGATITCVGGGTQDVPFSLTTGILQPDEQITCQATTLITQTDIDAGQVENSASVSATNPADSESEPATTQTDDPESEPATTQTDDPEGETIGADTGGPTVVVIPQTHTVDVVKTADNVTEDTVLKPGDQVSFTIKVTNTGNTTTNNILVTDETMPGLTITCDDQENGSISLAPGASIVCRTSSYTVTPADSAAGQIDNRVSVSNGDDDTTGGDDVIIPVNPAVSSITISKTGSLTMLNGIDPRPGDPITWLFTVTNTGETGLTNIVITDPQLDGATVTCVTGTEETPFNPASEVLPAGEQISCTATTQITQTDIDEGSVENSASVSATNPDDEDDPVDETIGADTGGPTVVVIPQTHTVDVVKTADNVTSDTVLKPGDQVSFTIKVTNTGNTTTNNILVTDETMPGLTITCDDQENGSISLAPGASIICRTSSYTVTPADSAAGQIDNRVSVSNGDDDTTGGDDVIIPVNPAVSSITISKTGSLTMLNGTDPRPGDPITWLFTVTNTGETGLTNIVITDPQLDGATVTCVTGTEETPFNPASELLPAGEQISCTATTQISQADIDEGSVTNTAAVTATNPDDPDSDQVTAETPDPAIVEITQTHTVDVVKTADNVTEDTVLKPGDTVAFTIKVTNTGNTTTNNILVTDETMPGLTITCDSDQPNGAISLEPGGQITCHTSSYTVTAGDATAGQIDNRVAVSNGDDGTTGGDDVVIPVNPLVSSMTISKTGSLTMLNGIDPRPGDPITWLFTVTNTGETGLTNIVITDPQLDGATITCVTGTEETPFNPASELLPAGEQISCTATTQISQADIDEGSVTNTASVTATNPDDPESDQVTAETPDPAQVDITQTHTVQVVKTADNVTSDTVLKPGDTISFTIKVTNTGNMTTTGITVTDETMPGLTITCDGDQLNGAISLEPGGQVTCHTSSYTVTAGDAAAGQIDNRVTVSNGDDDTTGGDDVIIPVEPAVSSITISKTGSLTMLNGVDARPGDPILWTFTVTNTGETSLSNIAIDDPQLDGATITCVTTDLQPVPFNPASEVLPAGEQITCQATTQITQTDIDTGSVTNSASVTATNPDDPDSDQVTAETPDPAQVDITQTHTVDVVKTADDVTSDTVLKPGDTVSFTIVVTNTGNTVTTGITVTDETMPGLTITCDSDQPNGAISLEPGGQVTCHTSPYTVTSDDATNGQIDNQVSVSNGDDDTTGGDDVIIPVNPAVSSITISKTGSLTMLNGIDPRPGDPITWLFTVTNTGETSLSNIAIDDPQLDGATITCVTTDLQPVPFNPASEVLPAGGTITCTATTQITQADIDEGSVTNTASVSATNPDDEDDPVGAETLDPAQVDITQTHTVQVVKTADNVTSDTVLKPGDTVAFTIVVTNIGNTVTNNILVTDVTMPGLTVTCDSDQPNGAIELEPEASVICHTSSYTVTADDATAGQIDNRVSVTNGDDDTTGGDDVIIPVNPAVSSLTISKTGSLTMLNGIDPRPGDPITWLFTVTNTGETDLTNIVITDPMLGETPAITCQTTDLQPAPFNPASEVLPAGGTITCQATTVITQTDIDTGSVTNSASVTATNPDDPDSDQVTAETPDPAQVDITQTHTVDVVKTADNVTSDTVLKPGDTVAFTIKVTNTGNMTTTGITVTDETMPDLEITCDQPNGAIELEPEASVICHTSSYTVTADDATNGQIDNQVTVSNGDDDTTGGDEIIIPVNPAAPLTTPVPGIRLTTATGAVEDALHPWAGDMITWTFEVTNTGNVSLSRVTIDDPQLPNIVCTLNGVSFALGANSSDALPTGEKIICTATSTVSQADIDNAGAVTIVSVSGIDPDGTKASFGPVTVVAPLAQNPDYKFEKKATFTDSNNNGQADVGETVIFRITLENLGNVTLNQVKIDDVTMPGLALTCTNQRTHETVEKDSISLPPGQSVLCVTDPYTITAADAAAGQIVNQATFTGTVGNPPVGGTPGEPELSQVTNGSVVTVSVPGEHAPTGGQLVPSGWIGWAAWLACATSLAAGWWLIRRRRVGDAV